MRHRLAAAATAVLSSSAWVRGVASVQVPRIRAFQPRCGVTSAASCLLAASAVWGGSAERTANVRIRQALATDIDAMKAINEEVLPENYPLAFYRMHLADWPGLQLVACAPAAPGAAGGLAALSGAPSAERVVGYCLAKMEVGSRGHITSIAVLPDFRNCGAATSIMHQVTERMRREHGALSVTLNVRKSNAAALHVYTAKLGYRAKHTWAQYYQDGEDALHLVQALPPWEGP